jgi:pimeloyl-ACP methyl ester carboxylesterase
MKKETMPITPQQHFETQFKSRFAMEVHGEQIPYQQISPQKEASSTPLVLLPGFTENADLLKKVIKKFYDDGRHVFTLTYPRGKLNSKHNGNAQAQEQKIEVTLALINQAVQFRSGKVDMLGRSDGGVNATYAAMHCSELLENLILVDTKLTAQENTISLSKRFLEHAAVEGKAIFTNPYQQSYLKNGVEQGIKYILPHIAQSAGEVIALAGSDIRAALAGLREEGIGVYGIHGTGDRIFPMKGVQKGIAEEGRKQQDPEILARLELKQTSDHQKPKTLFDGFYSAGPNIGHASIYNNEKYIKLISYVAKIARAKSEAK